MQSVKTMTYQEIASAFSITIGSAKNLVRRKRWSRITGNDGTARISVPSDEFDQHLKISKRPADTAIDSSVDAAIDAPTDTGIMSALFAAIQDKDQALQRLQEAHVEMARSLGKATADIEARDRALVLKDAELRDLRTAQLDLTKSIGKVEAELRERERVIAEQEAEIEKLKDGQRSPMHFSRFVKFPLGFWSRQKMPKTER